jgi:hypothetical protein
MTQHTYDWSDLDTANRSHYQRRRNQVAQAVDRIGKMHTTICDWVFDHDFGHETKSHYLDILGDLSDAQKALRNGANMDEAASIMERHNLIQGSPVMDRWSDDLHELACLISGVDSPADILDNVVMRYGG